MPRGDRERRDARTTVDLGDSWAPRILRGSNYQDEYVRYANERFGPEDDRAREDRFLELYGIMPSIGVMRARLTDDARHRCHEAVDDRWISELDVDLRPGHDLESQRVALERYGWLKNALERERAARGLAAISDLDDADPSFRRAVRQYEQLAPRIESISAIQAHLRCDGLLSSRARDGVFDSWTAAALKAFQRRHMIVSWAVVDAATRSALIEDSRELDFRQLLRALRERVADATGLIEDGTASAEQAPIAGRLLVAADFRAAAAELPHGAPDLIGRATDAAARDLGWSDPAAARAWLEAHADTATLTVPLRLPPRPRYHAAHMELRTEIDRGDVWYEYPYTASGARRAQRVERRPTAVLYARDGEREIPLVRWPTTIGGWQTERFPSGGVALRYKESDVGPRVWRDLIAGPAWLPPDSTPNEDLVRRSGRGWVLNREIFGPGYHSAYGMVMLINHQPVQRDRRTEAERRAGAPPELETIWLDNQVRMHGSVSYRSILRGHSHGCHRLFNHMAVRLGSFLLAHRRHVDTGELPSRYVRELGWQGRAYRLRIESRGHRYELTPPVPVEVLPGTIRGRLRSPPRGAHPLPETLAARHAAESGEGAAEAPAAAAPSP